MLSVCSKVLDSTDSVSTWNQDHFYIMYSWCRVTTKGLWLVLPGFKDWKSIYIYSTVQFNDLHHDAQCLKDKIDHGKPSEVIVIQIINEN